MHASFQRGHVGVSALWGLVGLGLTRALSFLAVGAALLLGGFFYQRLGVRSDRTRGIAEEL